MPLIGHTQILEYFDKVIARDALSHAYLFVGPQQIGKETMARHLASKLFDIPKEKLDTQPDFFVIQQTQDEKTGKTKRDISIDQIRELTQFLSQSPMLKTRKVAIIDGAEKLSIGAANAMLKTLEEPRGNTHLFLLTINEEDVPATVQSRCQTITFHPISEMTLEIALAERGASAEDASLFAKEAQGKPGLALTWLQDREAYTTYEHETQRFFGLLGTPFHAKLQAVEALFGKKEDHIAARQNLMQVLGVWQAACAAVVHGKSPARMPKENLLAMYQELVKAQSQLEENIHPRLLVEHILLALP